jgi:hypothetical protein
MLVKETYSITVGYTYKVSLHRHGMKVYVFKHHAMEACRRMEAQFQELVTKIVVGVNNSALRPVDLFYESSTSDP